MTVQFESEFRQVRTPLNGSDQELHHWLFKSFISRCISNDWRFIYRITIFCLNWVMIKFKCGKNKVLFIFKLIIHQHGTRVRDKIRLIRRKSMSKSSKNHQNTDWNTVFWLVKLKINDQGGRMFDVVQILIDLGCNRRIKSRSDIERI